MSTTESRAIIVVTSCQIEVTPNVDFTQKKTRNSKSHAHAHARTKNFYSRARFQIES